MQQIVSSSMRRSHAQSIDELVSLQAAERPEAAALSYAAQTLTYRELEERATALANALRNQGVGAGAVVGVCARRSPAMVIGSALWMPGSFPTIPLKFTAAAAKL